MTARLRKTFSAEELERRMQVGTVILPSVREKYIRAGRMLESDRYYYPELDPMRVGPSRISHNALKSPASERRERDAREARGQPSRLVKGSGQQPNEDNFTDALRDYTSPNSEHRHISAKQHIKAVEPIKTEHSPPDCVIAETRFSPEDNHTTPRENLSIKEQNFSDHYERSQRDRIYIGNAQHTVNKVFGNDVHTHHIADTTIVIRVRNHTNQPVYVKNAQGLTIPYMPEEKRAIDFDNPEGNNGIVLQLIMYFRDLPSARAFVEQMRKKGVGIKDKEYDQWCKDFNVKTGNGYKCTFDYFIHNDTMVQYPTGLYHFYTDLVIAFRDNAVHPKESNMIHMDEMKRFSALKLLRYDLGVVSGIRYVTPDHNAEPLYTRFADDVLTIHPSTDIKRPALNSKGQTVIVDAYVEFISQPDDARSKTDEDYIIKRYVHDHPDLAKLYNVFNSRREALSFIEEVLQERAEKNKALELLASLKEEAKKELDALKQKHEQKTIAAETASKSEIARLKLEIAELKSERDKAQHELMSEFKRAEHARAMERENYAIELAKMKVEAEQQKAEYADKGRWIEAIKWVTGLIGSVVSLGLLLKPLLTKLLVKEAVKAAFV